MKNNNFASKFSLWGFALFLIPITATSSFAITIYGSMIRQNLSSGLIALYMFLYIVVATLLFTLCDIIRRKTMIDKPVRQILEATQKIAVGDFDIELQPLHTYRKYDEYDLIMENINKMTKALLESENIKKEFVSNVSHEIKTPLSVIQNYSKALLTENLDKETKNKYLNVLATTSQKLSNFASNILKLNKLENQAIQSEKKPINIGEVLRENILQFENLIEKKNLKLTCDIEDIQFRIEESFLDLIFGNLISNAIKFTETSGKIKISLKNRENQIFFTVKDDGCGISKEVGNKIFEKFYQADTSHSSEGNGLGLTLVKKVIDIIGGEINVESKLGKGSTFTVVLNKEKNTKGENDEQI